MAEGVARRKRRHHTTQPMKKLLLCLGALAALLLCPLSSASAGTCPTYRVIGHTPCGKTIYSYFRVQGYDSHGRPVGQWVEQYPTSCRCRSSRPACGSQHPASIYHSNSPGYSFRIPR
jgi:hypothetical protein